MKNIHFLKTTMVTLFIKLKLRSFINIVITKNQSQNSKEVILNLLN